MKLIVTFLAFCLTFPLFAQQNTLQICFEEGKTNAVTTENQKLQGWLQQIRLTASDSIWVAAYSDKKGSETNNLALSKQRAETIRDLLTELGFTRIGFAYYGEQHETTPLINDGRVVSISAIKQADADMASQLLKTTQTFYTNATEDLIIKGAEGTYIVAAAGSFVTATGKVPTENLRVELKEFYKNSDMFLNGLTTVTPSQVLETGGTVEFRVYSGKEELQLKKGKTFWVGYANRKENDDMRLYYGQRNEEGTVMWEDKKVKVKYAGTNGGTDHYSVKGDDDVYGIRQTFDRNGLKYTDTLSRSLDELEVILSKRVSFARGSQVSFIGQFFVSSRTGLLNCDRPIKLPKDFPNTTLFVKVPDGLKPRIVFVPDDSPVIIPAEYAGPGLYQVPNLMQGRKGKLAGLCYKDGKQLYFALMSATATSQTYKLEFKPSAIDEAKQQAIMLD